jgi:voltage-dependent anion channel protein 2
VLHATYYQAIAQNGAQLAYRASWNRKVPNSLAMEMGAKYHLGDRNFVKAKIDNLGKLSVSYSSSLSPGVVLSLGASMDTNNFPSNAHKLGMSLVFGD